VSGDFPVQLATRLSDWSAGGLLLCMVLPVCPCVVSFSKFNEPDTRDILARMSRGCYEETAFEEFKLCRRHSGFIIYGLVDYCTRWPSKTGRVATVPIIFHRLVSREV